MSMALERGSQRRSLHVRVRRSAADARHLALAFEGGLLTMRSEQLHVERDDLCDTRKVPITSQERVAGGTRGQRDQEIDEVRLCTSSGEREARRRHLIPEIRRGLERRERAEPRAQLLESSWGACPRRHFSHDRTRNCSAIVS